MKQYNILMVEDEKEIIDLVNIYFINEGYNLFSSYTGEEGLEILKKNDIDLVVLDIMLPGIDGIKTCKLIRETMNIPIIMLSAKSEDMDKVIGLSMGADDYMVKPFNPIELIARIKSQLRRYYMLNSAGDAKPKKQVMQIKGLEINTDNHSVMLYGNNVKLTPKEYEILYLLASNAGKVFSSEEIFEKVWKEKYLDANNTIMVHMWRLREKIEHNPKKPEIIETLWGVGYKIEE